MSQSVNIVFLEIHPFKQLHLKNNNEKSCQYLYFQLIFPNAILHILPSMGVWSFKNAFSKTLVFLNERWSTAYVGGHSWIVFQGPFIKAKLWRQIIYFQESPCNIGDVRVSYPGQRVDYFGLTITTFARSRNVSK